MKRKDESKAKPKKPQIKAANSGSAAGKRSGQSGSARARETAPAAAQTKKAPKKKRSAKGKIFKTTDGKLGNRPDIKKPRKVAAVEQRKDDGAVAVVKLYSKDGKKRKAIIKDLTLYPAAHPSLTEKTIADSHVIIAVKQSDGSYIPIYQGDMTDTGDKLTKKELRAIKKGVHNDKPEHRKHYKSKIKKWKKHFKK